VGRFQTDGVLELVEGVQRQRQLRVRRADDVHQVVQVRVRVDQAAACVGQQRIGRLPPVPNAGGGAGGGGGGGRGPALKSRSGSVAPALVPARAAIGSIKKNEMNKFL